MNELLSLRLAQTWARCSLICCWVTSLIPLVQNWKKKQQLVQECGVKRCCKCPSAALWKIKTLCKWRKNNESVISHFLSHVLLSIVRTCKASNIVFFLKLSTMLFNCLLSIFYGASKLLILFHRNDVNGEFLQILFAGCCSSVAFNMDVLIHLV